MNPFSIITTLLGLALDALGIGEQEAGNFVLELDQWLCHITFNRGYAVLWDYGRTGEWEVYTHSHIPHDMVGFFLHTLYFNSTFEASQSLPTLLSSLATLGIEPLGYEVHEDDGPTIEFATASPLTMEAQTMLRLMPSPYQTFDQCYWSSYEQYQEWRNSDQGESSEDERIERDGLAWCEYAVSDQGHTNQWGAYDGAWFRGEDF